MKTLFFILTTLCVCATNIQAQLLLEITRNFDCGPCKLVDPPYEHFISLHPEFQATTVFYHNATPFTYDDFYQENTTDVDYRTKTFYTPPEPGANPTLYINGNFVSQKSNELDLWRSSTQEIYDIVKGQVHPTISLSSNDNGDGTYELTADIVGSTSSEVRPYVIITESGIVHANSHEYGVPESGVWDHIFRTMLPSVQGGEPFVLQGSKSLKFTFDPRGKSWNISKLQAIVILQNVAPNAVGRGSRDVVALKSSPTGFFGAGSVKQGTPLGSLQAYPNPFTERVTIPFSLKEPSHVTIRITDMLGREVATILNEKISEQQSSVTFVPQSLPAGTYVVNIAINGSLAGTEKLVYNP